MKWFLSLVVVIAIATVLIAWSPWDSSSDSIPRTRGNVHMIYQQHPAKNATDAYAGRSRWINANHFGGIRRQGRMIHAKLGNLAGREKIIRGHVLYVNPASHKRRVIKWSGKRAIPLHRKLKLIKGGQKHEVFLKWAYLIVHKRGYLLPPSSVKGD